MATKAEEEKAAADAAAAKAVEEAGAQGGEGSGEKMVQISEATLKEFMAKMSTLETNDANREAEMEGLRQAVDSAGGADTVGVPKLREKKNFEPKFRTVRLRKFPIAGDEENMGIVSGWTSKGAYQLVDRTGERPVTVDYLDIIFLGHERDENGKLKAERVKLLDLLNAGEVVVCKILSMKKEEHKVPTGEEIDVTVWDPQHGLMATGDTVDGYVGMTDITYSLQIPGILEPVEIDGQFVN